MLKIDIITIFPDAFENIAGYGVLKEAFRANICILNVHDLRDFSSDKHRKIDDRPYGGGPGMIFMPEPLDKAINHIKKRNRIKVKEDQKTILLSPKGGRLSQPVLKNLSNHKNLILICGRYEGIDQRIIDSRVDVEVSIGDYVLTGGEIPAMVLIDGIIRLLPGVLGSKESLDLESFSDNLLDHPQYTRPASFKNMKVPDVLIGGNHKGIQKWRKEQSLKITKKRRPDLFDKNS